MDANKPITIGFVNQHAYNLINEDNKIAIYFDSLTYRLRDGAGVKLACKVNNCNAGKNLNGTDFIPELVDSVLKKEDNCNLFIFGTKDPWLRKGSYSLTKRRSSHLLDGFQRDDVYLDTVKKKSIEGRFNLIILAMGMPKQERIASLLQNSIQGPAIIICGGAIIDFYARRFDRAPLVMRKFGLEWLYRLLKEPKRLFNRYVIGIPKFIFYCLINNVDNI